MMVRAIAKDVHLLVRDRGALISLFALPVVFMFVFGFAFERDPGTPSATMSGPYRAITSFQLAVPGNATLFGFFIALTVAMAFTTERRTGTWRRLLAAPVPRWKALVSTLVPYYLVGVCQLAFLFLVGIVGFGVQVPSSLLALAVLSLATVACAVSLGLLFAALGGSERQLGGIGSVVLLIMGMLGGCMIPRPLMPELMQTIGLAVPHAWALDGYYALLSVPGTGVREILPSVGALLGFSAGFGGLGLALFRFER